MPKRILIAVSLVFWCTMNYLLWKSEFASGNEPGAPVPFELVAEKILTCPDNSMLEIHMGNKRIGMARWYANILEKQAARKKGQNALEGMVRETDHYTLDIDGTINLDPGSGTGLLYYIGFSFDNELNWEVMRMRISQRPLVWDIEANATNKTVMVIMANGPEPTTSTFTFEQLSDPKLLATEFYGPFMGELLGKALEPFIQKQTNSVAGIADQIGFEARHTWLEIHGARTRIYELELNAFQDFKVLLTVSRVGEIIKGDLPFEITLRNDGL